MDHVNLIKGGFSNCYFIIEKTAIIIVDIGSSKEVENIIRHISSVRDLTSKEIDGSFPDQERPVIIFSTHFHVDHIAGISYLLEKLPGAEVSFYKKVKDFLSRKEKICIPPVRAWFGNLPPVYLKLDRHIPSTFEIKRDDRIGIPLPFLRNMVSVRYEIHHWIKDGDSIPHAPDWKVLSTPGHTTDSACLWNEKENILISGDTILNMNGRGELNRFCCNYSQIKGSFNDLKAHFSVGRLYPGHGSPITSGDNLLSEVKVWD